METVLTPVVDCLTLKPVRAVRGEIQLPGSKSISNRALIMAALSPGTTRLTNLLDADDVRRMLEALRALGVDYEMGSDTTVCTVCGVEGPLGRRGLEKQELNLGNAGTAMRPLCAVLAAGAGQFILTGDARMQERPIGDLVEALRQMGADIEYLGATGFPPLRLMGRSLRGGTVTVNGGVSSQFLTALLIVAPLTAEGCVLRIKGELVSRPYIHLTLRMLARFGIKVEQPDDSTFRIAAGQEYQSPGEFLIEGDASGATYFFAAAAISGSVRVRGLNRLSIQGDIQFLEVLEKMGARVVFHPDAIEVSSNDLRGVDLDLNHIPDAAMTIAILAVFAKGRTVIRNIANWRVKETDRLTAMATELRKIGATVEEGADWIGITPPQSVAFAAIDTYHDHRMAMCFSLLALSPVGVAIKDPACVNKTFPKYFSEFASIFSL